MGKAMGPSFLTFEEVESRNLLKKGDIIQIWQGLGHMPTVLFKDYEQCYHVAEEKNDKNSCSPFRNALKTETIGTSGYISKNPLKHILYSGPRYPNGDPIIQRDSEGNIIAPKLNIFRINNQESEAVSRGIDVNLFKSEAYLDNMFAVLDKQIDQQIEYKSCLSNCDSYVYVCKYGEKWTQHKVAISGIANITFERLLNFLNKFQLW